MEWGQDGMGSLEWGQVFILDFSPGHWNGVKSLFLTLARRFDTNALYGEAPPNPV
jgi:hypothetical protein